MNLTERFTLEEMLRSDAATRLSIVEQFHTSVEISDNLTALCKNVLEPLHDKVKAPIYISSGYRCSRVNKAIGGAANSQHTLGQAADISISRLNTEDLYQFIKNSGIPFDQLIQEFDKWVHVSYNQHGTNRQQRLRAVKENAKTVYHKD